MNLHPEDPRITAYVLGELDTHDAEAVEHAAAADPAIRQKIIEAQDIQRFLRERLTPPTNQLHPHQRNQIRRTASLAPHQKKTVLRRFPTWFIPATAAAVIILAAFALIKLPAAKPTALAKTSPTPLPPATEILKAPAPPNLPPAPVQASIKNPGFLSASDFPALDLPILPGQANLSSLTRPIRDAGRLPPHDAVRLEEILNSFPLRLSGTSAIARSSPGNWHPDKRDGGISAHLATLSTEMIACPWKPSATLLLISARANSQKNCNLKITFHPNAENVFRYRVLGFNPGKDKAPQETPTQLTADSYTTLAIEIESSKPAADLGSLEWSADGNAAPPISLQHKPAAEPSDDARFAALVCTYAQWLAGEQTGIIDKQILSALVRENTSATPPPDHADFINLIETSLQLQTN
jgi:hypothetical protein